MIQRWVLAVRKAVPGSFGDSDFWFGSLGADLSAPESAHDYDQSKDDGVDDPPGGCRCDAAGGKEDCGSHALAVPHPESCEEENGGHETNSDTPFEIPAVCACESEYDAIHSQ